MQFTDAVTVAGTRRRADGSLLVDARVARTGIQTYAGHEVGKPEMSIVRVYRPEAEVFHRDALASFAHRPVTNDHPSEMVTADNWRQVAVGNTTDEVTRDGQFVRVPLMVSDAGAIADIEAGKRELSAGYACDLEFTPGTTPDGEAYDAFQKTIRSNHVAIVQRGRAGSQVRIGDGAVSWGAAPITVADERNPHMADTLRNVMVDGLSVSTTDQGAQAIDKLTKDRDALQTRLSDADKAHAQAIAAKDEEIGTLKADLKKAQDAALKPADLDKMVADRATLVNTVKTIDAKIVTDGKTDAELRQAAVAAKLGDEMVKDASEAEITGMFKAIAKDAKPVDPFAKALSDGIVTVDAKANTATAHKSMTDHLTSAWQTTKGAA